MRFFKTLLTGAVLAVSTAQASGHQATIKNSSQCEFQKVYSKVSGYKKAQYPERIAKGSEYGIQFVFSDLLGVSYKAHIRYDVICDNADAGDLVIFNVPSDPKAMVLCMYSNQTKLSSGKQCDILIDSKNSTSKLVEIQGK